MFSESSLLDSAVAAYEEATFRSDLPVAARVNAARRFRAIIAMLDKTGDALPSFVAAISSEDAYGRNASARALAGTQWPQATEQLLRAYATRGPQLDGAVLRQLGRHAPLPDNTWGLLERVRPFERGTLVGALLRRPSAVAEQRWREVIAGDDDTLAEHAIDAVARWGRPDLLRALLAEPRRPVPPGLPRGLPPDLRPRDIRLPAAFQLALRGDHGAIEFLLEQAVERNAEHAIDAILHLADLGLPGAVVHVARHLRGRNRYALEFAMEAAVSLGTPILGPALCDVAERTTSRGYPSPSDQALRVLATITGVDSADPAGDDGSATPLASRRRGAIVQRTALAELDVHLRYHAGEPLTLAHLVEDLMCIHHGPVRRAAYGLQAITGEDFGFDPADDLIANLDALEAWRARAKQPAPVGPGEWAFHGKRLPPPEVPV